MKYLVLFGRILYAAVFIVSVPGHFTADMSQYAAAHGVPLAPVAVPVAGIIAFLGGVSVLTGYKAKKGAWLLVLYLAPVTLMIHNFWDLADPSALAAERVHFMKNVSMLGAALLIAYYGSGPFSLEGASTRRSRKRHGTKIIDLTSNRGR